MCVERFFHCDLKLRNFLLTEGLGCCAAAKVITQSDHTLINKCINKRFKIGFKENVFIGCLVKFGELAVHF